MNEGDVISGISGLGASRDSGARPRAVAVINPRARSGKTTTCVSIAAALAEHGASTLLVDLDPRGCARAALGHRLGPNDSMISRRRGLDVVGADRIEELATLLSGNAPYDYVFFDSAPSRLLPEQAALSFASGVLAPIACDAFALQAVKELWRALVHFEEALGQSIEVIGALPTFYDAHDPVSRDALSALEQHFGERALSPIARGTVLADAAKRNATIFEFAPASDAARSYAAAAQWIARRTIEGSAPPIRTEPAPRRMTTDRHPRSETAGRMNFGPVP